jgi:hypothetical protein
MTLRTTLRFTSVMAGVGLLILWAAIILSANDWLPTSSNAHRRTAVQASVPAPQIFAPAPQAIAPLPQTGAPAPAPSAPPSQARSDSVPEVVRPAAVSAPRPPTAVVQLAVRPASRVRAAMHMAPHDEEQPDQPAGNRQNDVGHGHGRDQHGGGRGNGGWDR